MRYGRRERRRLVDRDGHEQLERDDAEPGRERPVPGGEGNDELRERERHDRVERDRADMDGDEEPGEEAEEAVHVLDGEAGEPGNGRLAGEQDARRARSRRRAGTRRRRLRGRRTRRRSSSDYEMHTAASASRGQPPARTISPSRRDEPALQPAALEPGRPVVAEEEGGLRGDVGCQARRGADGHALPRASDGAPVAGSIRWCARPPP